MWYRCRLEGGVVVYGDAKLPAARSASVATDALAGPESTNPFAERRWRRCKMAASVSGRCLPKCRWSTYPCDSAFFPGVEVRSVGWYQFE